MRTASAETFDGPREPDAWWTALPSGPAIATLLELAARGETGVLEFVETPGAAVYLADGAVTQVVSPTVPDVARRILRLAERPASRESGGDIARAAGDDGCADPAPEVGRGPGDGVQGAGAGGGGFREGVVVVQGGRESQAGRAVRDGAIGELQVRALIGDAVADAALDAFAGPSLTRFTPGRRHWMPLPRPLRAGLVLDETARRRRVLNALAGRARPDEPVTRAATLPVERIRLTARQWDLVRLADGRTPRAMARELASGVFQTTVEVAALAQAGVLAPASPDLREHPPMPFLHAVSDS